MRGSVIFKIIENQTFASPSACVPPQVMVEPPPAGGVQAEIVLEYTDTQVDYYSNIPSSSITARNKGFSPVAYPLQYRIRVVDAGSGYMTSPRVVVHGESDVSCLTIPTIQAFVRNGLVASRVELVRKISLPEASSSPFPVEPTRSQDFQSHSAC